MCDYSLEIYKSREAKDDEELILHKFPSSSHGFVSAGDTDCAVCCKPGVEMRITYAGYVLNAMQENVLLEGEIPVTFHTNAGSWGHKDGVILPNGMFVSLQSFRPGMKAVVTKALPKEIVAAISTPRDDAVVDPDKVDRPVEVVS